MEPTLRTVLPIMWVYSSIPSSRTSPDWSGPVPSFQGVVVYFNETSTLNQSSTPVPWIAFVSCDPDNPSTQATLALPFDTNGTVATNSTLENNNSTMTNSTDLTNSTMSEMNSTDSTTTNTTTTINGVNSTYLPDVFSLAAQLGASSVLLYSQQSEVSFPFLSLDRLTQVLTIPSSLSVVSTQLYRKRNVQQHDSDFLFSLSRRDRSNPVFSIRVSHSRNSSTRSLLHNWNTNPLPDSNIDESYRYFNSSLISSSASNLTSIISSPNNNTLPTRFLIGRLTAAYNKNDSSNGVVATIGRAPTSTRTSQGSAQTGGSDPAPSSGAERIFGSTLALLAAGLVVIVGW